MSKICRQPSRRFHLLQKPGNCKTWLPRASAEEGTGVHTLEAKVNSTFVFVPFGPVELFALAVGISSAVCDMSLCKDHVQGGKFTIFRFATFSMVSSFFVSSAMIFYDLSCYTNSWLRSQSHGGKLRVAVVALCGRCGVDNCCCVSRTEIDLTTL